MENKNSFILYADLIHTVSKLPDDTAGKLFKLILDHVNGNDPDAESLDLILQVTFEPIKQQLKRDLSKWENYIDKQRINGSKGGAPKGNQNAKKTTETTQRLKKQPKQADSVNVSVNDVIKEKEFLPESIEELTRQRLAAIQKQKA